MVVLIYVYGILFAATAILFVAQKVNRLIRKRKYVREHGCQPPATLHNQLPFGIDRVREMLRAAREKRFQEMMQGRYLQTGNTFQSTILGRSYIFTIDPRNVQTVLALKFKDFDLGDNRNYAFRPLLGQGIFCSDGPIWEHSRALVRPNFTRNQVADINVYDVHVSNLLRLIPRTGSTVDLQDLFFRMTIDSATEFLFGESVHTLAPHQSADASRFAADFNQAQDTLAFRIRIGPINKFHRSSEFLGAVQRSRAYVDQFVQKAIRLRQSPNHDESQNINKHYVFLNELSKKTLDATELTDQLLNILLAGRDTTASLLSMVFFTLAKRQDVWKNLKTEVDLLNGRKPSFTDLKGMSYLTWVLNETLRLYPVVPTNIRMANKDTFLPVGGGPDGNSPVFVPKGMDVVYTTYSMHRLQSIYGPDAEEFRPERWGTLKPGWGYIPFNGGPRICVGQQFALTEAGYTTVRILQQFKGIESRDPEPWMEALTLTMASKNGVKVAMIPE
ncbi:n-alkane-inducible cytochrome P450 [Aspergillus pseudoustus]|uniref:N-alkane-inducible cytochrome P450 n=1 Tax=Aspergillus pseudoustus TaxID=1810923 RepID=A0ABR4KYJ7_9EURO